ncbi:MAG: aldo/keto reductase [Clostridia bacterium]|nr:aldo/keto reductase [Clostridia bacterium]
MEYRVLPCLTRPVGVVAIGGGNLHALDAEATTALLDFAEENGVNLIDMALSHPQPLDSFRPALAGRRERFVVQMHLGMSFLGGEYARDYRLDAVRRSFEQSMEKTSAAYADLGCFHCVDNEEELRAILDGGVLDYALELKKAGLIRGLSFSSHTVDIANRFLDTGVIDACMFSINAAYDLDPAAHDPYAASYGDRAALYRRCAAAGVGILVMKAFGGGLLLDARRSPLGRAMSVSQCLQYALDRPGVTACALGVHSRAELAAALAYFDAAAEARDYGALLESPGSLAGACVYCNHCMPCPEGIDIGQTHKFLDLHLAGDPMAKEHYASLAHPASDCAECGLCESRCPFRVEVREKLRKARCAFGY